MFGFIKNFLMGSAILSSLVCTTTLSRKNEDECSSCIFTLCYFQYSLQLALVFIILFTINT